MLISHSWAFLRQIFRGQFCWYGFKDVPDDEGRKSKYLHSVLSGLWTSDTSKRKSIGDSHGLSRQCVYGYKS